MGKHKEKHKKHKKDKSRKHKRKHYSTSSSEEEWVEKKNESSSEEEMHNKSKRKEINEDFQPDKKYKCDDAKNEQQIHYSNTDMCSNKRDEWMNLPTSFLSMTNNERKQKREEKKQLERQQQQYNPQECSRELNPYWRDGGKGLPIFKKPKDFQEDNIDVYHKVNNKKIQNWKKSKSTYTISSAEENKQVKLDDKTTKENILSETDLNQLAAKLVKAEIMGNEKLIKELKDKLKSARNSYKNVSTISEEAILLTHTDSKGRTLPVKGRSDYGESSTSHKKKKAMETHRDGQRVRYFADDDKYSLKQMFENEKYNSAQHQNSEFVNMVSKVKKNDDLDDIFADNIRKKESSSKIDSKTRARAINECERVNKSLDSCSKCIQSELMLKHLMISMGNTLYLAVPATEPLTKDHCLIIPIRHVSCSTQLDENEWSEILDIRKSLVNLFQTNGQDVIFFETAMFLHRFPHMYIECIPVPKENGDEAPIYFKKAIDESETEWAQNKKLVSLKGRDVRKAIPNGLPYFTVSFGMEEGFAHVVEDEQLFPSNFAQEIIGGMLDLHHSKWRNPKKQRFEEQSKRVLDFSRKWTNFECTT